MDPTCRSCGGYPCDCGRAIGVPILREDGSLWIRDFSSMQLLPYEEPRAPTEEELKAQRELRAKETADLKKLTESNWEAGTCSSEVANEYLFKAVNEKYMETAKRAISLGASPNLKWSINSTHTDMAYNSDCLLHIAIEKGDIAMLKFLLESGANPNVVGKSNNNSASSFTPLMCAVRRDSPQEQREMVKLLMEYKADKSPTDSVGRTAASMPGAERVAALLR